MSVSKRCASIYPQSHYCYESMRIILRSPYYQIKKTVETDFNSTIDNALPVDMGTQCLNNDYAIRH